MNNRLLSLLILLYSSYTFSMENPLKFIKVKENKNHEPAHVLTKEGFEPIKEIFPHTYSNPSKSAVNHEAQVVANQRNKALVITFLKTQKVIEYYGHPNEAQCIAFNPEGSLLIAGYNATMFNNHAIIVIWDTNSEKPIIKIKSQNPEENVSAITFFDQETKFACGLDNGTIKTYNISDPQTYSTVTLTSAHNHDRPILDLAYNSNNQLASLCSEEIIKIWNISGIDLTHIQTIELNKRARIIGFYPNSSTLFAYDIYTPKNTKEEGNYHDITEKVDYWSISEG